jgi:hypothetical protein
MMVRAEVSNIILGNPILSARLTHEKLCSSDRLSPRFYGLPKIHKLDIPLRAIVSFVNTPTTYGVSSFFKKILSAVVGNTENAVKNSCHFAEFVRSKNLKADQMLVSFVVFLFTKIPVDLAIKVATKRLKQDATLLQRTVLACRRYY